MSYQKGADGVGVELPAVTSYHIAPGGLRGVADVARQKAVRAIISHSNELGGDGGAATVRSFRITCSWCGVWSRVDTRINF
jgi:hypothetical protein